MAVEPVEEQKPAKSREKTRKKQKNGAREPPQATPSRLLRSLGVATYRLRIPVLVSDLEKHLAYYPFFALSSSKVAS
ncbi:hypothetical protein TNCV_1819951 [Trichonephila clavipes]|nr:hypothetical protein TNCV_1819951 [Trichonephila clavipes]